MEPESYCFETTFVFLFPCFPFSCCKCIMLTPLWSCQRSWTWMLALEYFMYSWGKAHACLRVSHPQGITLWTWDSFCSCSFLSFHVSSWELKSNPSRNGFFGDNAQNSVRTGRVDDGQTSQNSCEVDIRRQNQKIQLEGKAVFVKDIWLKTWGENFIFSPPWYFICSTKNPVI